MAGLVNAVSPKDSDKDGIPDTRDARPFDHDNDGIRDKVVDGKKVPNQAEQKLIAEMKAMRSAGQSLLSIPVPPVSLCYRT